MNRRGVASLGVICGALTGAVTAAALLANPVAHAESDAWAIPVPPYGPYPSIDFVPYEFGPPTSTNYQSIPGGFSEDNAYTSLPGYPEGSFDTTYQQQMFGSFPFYETTTEKVTDATGAAPVVGTTWDSSESGVVIPNPAVSEGLQIPFWQNYSVSDPTGMADDFVVGASGPGSIQNQFYDGPAGVFDYMVFGTGNPIPIFDFPAAASSTAADLASAGDAGTLWSDLVAAL